MRTVSWNEDSILVVRRPSRGRPATLLLVESGSPSYPDLLARSENLERTTAEHD